MIVSAIPAPIVRMLVARGLVALRAHAPFELPLGDNWTVDIWTLDAPDGTLLIFLPLAGGGWDGGALALLLRRQDEAPFLRSVADNGLDVREFLVEAAVRLGVDRCTGVQTCLSELWLRPDFVRYVRAMQDASEPSARRGRPK